MLQKANMSFAETLFSSQVVNPLRTVCGAEGIWFSRQTMKTLLKGKTNKTKLTQVSNRILIYVFINKGKQTIKVCLCWIISSSRTHRASESFSNQITGNSSKTFRFFCLFRPHSSETFVHLSFVCFRLKSSFAADAAAMLIKEKSELTISGSNESFYEFQDCENSSSQWRTKSWNINQSDGAKEPLSIHKCLVITTAGNIYCDKQDVSLQVSLAFKAICFQLFKIKIFTARTTIEWEVKLKIKRKAQSLIW